MSDAPERPALDIAALGLSPQPDVDEAPAPPGGFNVPPPPTDCAGCQQVINVPAHRPDMLVRLLGSGWSVLGVTSTTVRQAVGGPLQVGGPPQMQLVTRLAYHLVRTAPEGTPPGQLLMHIE